MHSRQPLQNTLPTNEQCSVPNICTALLHKQPLHVAVPKGPSSGKQNQITCINCNWLLCAQLTYSVSTRCLVKNEVKCWYSVALWQPAYSTNTSSNDTASHPRTPELISNAAATASDFASCDAVGRRCGGVDEAKN